VVDSAGGHDIATVIWIRCIMKWNREKRGLK
jgi:hypothetical protein